MTKPIPDKAEVALELPPWTHHGYTDKGIEPPVLSYILQRPIRSVQYCEYVLYSRVTSSLSFFEVLALLEMVGHPPLGEPIKLASCVWE